MAGRKMSVGVDRSLEGSLGECSLGGVNIWTQRFHSQG